MCNQKAFDATHHYKEKLQNIVYLINHGKKLLCKIVPHYEGVGQKADVRFDWPKSVEKPKQDLVGRNWSKSQHETW